MPSEMMTLFLVSPAPWMKGRYWLTAKCRPSAVARAASSHFWGVGVDLVGELFGAFHEDVHVGLHGLVLLSGFHFQGEVGDLVEVGLLVGVVDERGQAGQRASFGFDPEPIVA